MAGCPGEGEAVALSEEYRLAMQTPQYERELAEGSYPNELCRGLGTQITDHLLPDRRMVGHQGNAYGSICGLFYDPETRTGFALLTNGALGQRNAAGVFRLNEDTAQAVYAAFFGLERELQYSTKAAPGKGAAFTFIIGWRCVLPSSRWLSSGSPGGSGRGNGIPVRPGRPDSQRTARR